MDEEPGVSMWMFPRIPRFISETMGVPFGIYSFSTPKWKFIPYIRVYFQNLQTKYSFCHSRKQLVGVSVHPVVVESEVSNWCDPPTGVEASAQQVAFVAAEQAADARYDGVNNHRDVDPLAHARTHATRAIQDQQEILASHAAEPSDLDQWDADRMHGTFQVGKGVVCQYF